MTTRNYKVFFDLHSVVGMVISFALFIIFFAGAFALFEPEIHHWEEKESVSPLSPIRYPGRDAALSTFDYDGILADLKEKGIYLSGRNLSFMRTGIPGEVSIFLGDSQDSLPGGVDGSSRRLLYDTRSESFHVEKDGFSMGHLMVELHFFGQLGEFGTLLAGFVALFFLVAILTGIGVHWKNLSGNFFLFRSRAKLKMLLTDAHTVLGVLGIPYQVMYAVTGAYFCLGVLLTAPTGLFKASVPVKVEEPSLWPSFPRGAESDTARSINACVAGTLEKWPGYEPTYLAVSNYSNDSMYLQVDGRADIRDRMFGFGSIIYHVPSGKVVKENDPFHTDYVAAVPMAMWMLHYGEFDRMVGQASDLFFRAVYFLLALATCFVIVSGVIMWIEVRQKRDASPARRRFNGSLANFFAAACMTMFPVTAGSFIASKLFPGEWGDARVPLMNAVFFGGWLISTLGLWLKSDRELTIRATLLAGGLAGLCIPLAGGLRSGNWIWRTYALRHYDVFIVDALWFSLALTALYSAARLFINKKRSGGESTL